MPAPGQSPTMEGKLNQPYLLGVYLAVNALRDAGLIVDGADCALFKGEWIFGNHDLFSSLYAPGGRHRLISTQTYPTRSVLPWEGRIIGKLDDALADDRLRAIFFSEVPFCSVIGSDYDRILRAKRRAAGKPILHIPARSLAPAADWLTGYEDVLAAIAREIDLRKARPRPRSVALVGYLCDRAEHDHGANCDELRRMLGALGLEVASIWLDGSPWSELANVRDASAILSLPYGRQAARILADRLHVELLELDLPFGIGASERWMEALAAAFSRERAGRRFLDAAREGAYRNLSRLVQTIFLHKRVVFFGDPHLGQQFQGFAHEIGLHLAGAFMSARHGHLSRAGDSCAEAPAPDSLLFDASPTQCRDALDRMPPPDLLVGNTFSRQFRRQGEAFVEFGFPSYLHHALGPEPFLGFAGGTAFTGRLLNALLERGWGDAHRAPSA